MLFINKIASILSYYTSNNTILDKNAVLNIIKIYLSENNICCDINDVVFCECPSLGCYIPKYKTIYLDINKICNSAMCLLREYVNVRYIDLCNEILLITLFHELNHAIRLPLQLGNNVIDNINYYTFNLLDNNYHYYPSNAIYLMEERQAVVFSYEICLKIYQCLSNYYDVRGIINDLYKRYMQLLTCGYSSLEYLDSPLKKIVLNPNYATFRQFEDYQMIESDINSINVSLYDRLQYGFPINYGEEEYIIGLRDTIYNYQQRIDLDIKKMIMRQ